MITKTASLFCWLFISHGLIFGSTCPIEGGVYHGRSYKVCFFLVFESDTSLIVKNEKCKAFGGVLSNIPDSGAMSFLAAAIFNEHMDDNNTGITLSTNDLSTEGVYVNLDNSVQNWIDWGPGQPDNCCGGENCMFLYTEKGNVKVNDYLCTLKVEKNLCQIKLESAVSTIAKEQDIQRRRFSKLHHENTRSAGELINTIKTGFQLDCAARCSRDVNCRLFTYDSKTKTCTQFSTPKISVTTSTKFDIPPTWTQAWIIR